MKFTDELASAAGPLTAAQIASATGASKRTVEGWRSGKEPLPAYRPYILACIKRARKAAERTKRKPTTT
jgi:hypothetical protein